MKEKNNNQEIEKLREHITKCLIDKINNFNFSINQSIQYQITIKTWCITLFMASIGFCLTTSLKNDYKQIYNLLPFLPVLMFWFLHGYRDHLNDLRLKDEHLDEIMKVLSEIFEYSYEDLKRISKDLIPKKFESWPNRGKTKPLRALEKTFIFVPKNMFFHYENVFFFGMMCLVWGLALLFLF